MDDQQLVLRGQANVGKACNNCRKAHIACDDTERPCRRCVRLEIGHLCVDVPVRKRGRPSWRSTQQQGESSGDAPNPRGADLSSLLSPSSSSSSASSSPPYCTPPANDGVRMARPAKSRRSPCAQTEDAGTTNNSPTARTGMTTDRSMAAVTTEAVDQLQRLANQLSLLVAELTNEVNCLKESNLELEHRLVQLEDAHLHHHHQMSWYDAPQPQPPQPSVSDGSGWAGHQRGSSASSFPAAQHLPPHVPPFSSYTWY